MSDARARQTLFLRCLRVLAACALGCWFPACDSIERAPDAEPPRAEDTATPPPAEKTWADLPVAKPDDRITIHYHRPDGNYEGVNLWTWDSKHRNTPKQNALEPVGRDAFGAVFQLDRASYGGAEVIGLIPRLGPDWSRKDGGDRFWTPSLGNEIWLVGGKDTVHTQAPDLSPRVEAAFIESTEKIVVRLSQPPAGSPQFMLLDEQQKPLAAAAVIDAQEIIMTPEEPLDITGSYTVRVEGFGDPVALVPRGGLLDDREKFYDADARLGASYTPESTTFRLFAPTAKSVGLVLHDTASGNKGRQVQALEKQSKGIWQTTVNGDLRGKYYAYVLGGPELDPKREVLDPYAISTVANSTRGLVTALPVPGPGGPKVASPVDMIVYEIHVRDFTIAPNSGVEKRGLYLGFGEPDTRLVGDAEIRTALDHLTELGITHVQILPVHDFDNDEGSGAYNWGYMTSAFFSPEGMFATDLENDSRVREFKALIDALHARGIGVIMDVVYNHTADNAPLRSVVPRYYYRYLDDGSLANGSGCGNEFRSEAPMARKLIVDSLKLWVHEYGVDGFRFDLMALIDQETMREAERELRRINSDIVLYGEPWTASATPLQEKADKQAMRELEPLGAFNDDFRNALKGSPDGADPGWIQNGSNRDALVKALQISDWFASPAQSINYLTCHDNLVLWDKLKSSMKDAPDALLKETMKLGYLALFTAQGVPFLHGGEEFARSKGGHHNSYNAPDSVNQVDWSLKRKHLDLFHYTRDLIALRKAHPLFRLRTREEIAQRLKFESTPDEKSLMFTIDGNGVRGETWKRVCVVMNPDTVTPAEFTLPSGMWSVAIDEKGAAQARTLSGKVKVRPKSGLVLYQR